MKYYKITFKSPSIYSAEVIVKTIETEKELALQEFIKKNLESYKELAARICKNSIITEDDYELECELDRIKNKCYVEFEEIIPSKHESENCYTTEDGQYVEW